MVETLRVSSFVSKIGYFSSFFAVLIEATSILFSSRQSVKRESPMSLVKYSDIVSNLSQYSVSEVSFRAICILEIKSALL